jgi:hypothetical protein
MYFAIQAQETYNNYNKIDYDKVWQASFSSEFPYLSARLQAEDLFHG